MLTAELTKCLDSQVQIHWVSMNWFKSHNLLGGAHNLEDLAEILGSERKSDTSCICTDGPALWSQ